MNHKILYAFCLLLLIPEILVSKGIAIIPRPQLFQEKEGVFVINQGTSIMVQEELTTKANQLKNYLEPALGFELSVTSKSLSGNYIELKKDKNLVQLGNEGYKLEINPNKISLSAFSEKGIFWGIQTLRQLLPDAVLREAPVEGVNWEIPCLVIEDSPRYNWRGLMLDCSRTFIPKEEIKKYIEAISFFKMNVLHMHLTDDQGWRIEIKKYPELTQIASRFHESFNEPEEYAGFYSQDDIKELVAFAAVRNVEIVPEIEMPGHTYEVFAAYPQLSCKGDTSKIKSWMPGLGLHKEIFCAGNIETFEFIENVLDEITMLFPSQYVHIGGDEAPKDYWKTCEKCQNRIKDENLANEDELQSWFVKRIEKYLNSKSKKLIGWDEIMDGGLSPGATVMYWRSWEKTVAREIPEIKNDIIFTPTSHCYFDYTYEKISSERMYSFNPVFNEHNQTPGNILGVQANFWSHLDRTSPQIDRQLFPRLLALAEVGWTEKDKKDWNDFKIRLQSKLNSLEIIGIHYFKENY